MSIFAFSLFILLLTTFVSFFFFCMDVGCFKLLYTLLCICYIVCSYLVFKDPKHNKCFELSVSPYQFE